VVLQPLIDRRLQEKVNLFAAAANGYKEAAKILKDEDEEEAARLHAKVGAHESTRCGPVPKLSFPSVTTRSCRRRTCGCFRGTSGAPLTPSVRRATAWRTRRRRRQWSTACRSATSTERPIGDPPCLGPVFVCPQAVDLILPDEGGESLELQRAPFASDILFDVLKLCLRNDRVAEVSMLAALA
jgi:hypothetical protein